MSRLKGFRYPREIIAYAVWAYHRVALNKADVEDLMVEWSVIVSHEAVRLWINQLVSILRIATGAIVLIQTTNGTRTRL